MTLSFYHFEGRQRLWAFAMMGLARPLLRRTPGLSFWKLFGAGSGTGFLPRPDTHTCAILGVWPDADAARSGTTQGVFARYARRAREAWCVHLAPVSVRGDWSGRHPFEVGPDDGAGPLAALTRATIRVGAAPHFWRRVPELDRLIGLDPNVAFRIGIGEVPLRQQVTFSIWPDAATMAAFARGGPHARAIRAVREGGWFREELYARFRVTSASGTWDGRRPLADLGVPA